MKITICGSIAFYDEMMEVKEILINLGHEVDLPPFEIEDDTGKMIPVKEYYERRKIETSNVGWIWDEKERAMRLHLKKIEWADSILVLNYDKNDIANYVGGNTLIEIGVAFYLKKKIFLYNPIPEMNYKEEILGMKPILINRNLEAIE